jgi:hypothetical protein
MTVFYDFEILWDDIDYTILYKPRIVLTPDHILL